MTSIPPHSIYRTYIEPFKDLNRSLTFLGGFLGVLGFFLINNLSAYAFATDGYVGVISYFLPALIVTGLIYWPMLYAGFSAFDGMAWRIGLCVTQLLAVVYYISSTHTPIVQGVMSGIVMAPFWCIYHVAMAQNTSKENRGFEVTLSLLINAVGCLAAAGIIAYFLTNQTQETAAIIAMCSLMAGTLCLLFANKIVRQHSVKEFIKESLKVAHDNPYMIRRIIAEGAFEIPKFTFAALMFVMGHSALNMALVLAAQIITMFFLSPLIGKFAHMHRKESFGIGLLIMGLGWLVIAVAPAYLLSFFISLILYAIGATFADSSLKAGIYEMQQYASMMWTEFYLAVSRVAALFLLLPLLYYNPTVYLVTLTCLAGVLFFMNKHWQKRYADGIIM